MTAHYDLILVGGGLANGLIALRLKQTRPELNVLLLEQSSRAGGNHTWSFHDSDLTVAQWEWVGPLVGRRWPRHRVIFPGRNRTLDSGYASIFSEDFATILSSTLGDTLSLNSMVIDLSPTHVHLADGRRLEAGAVIDGRGAPDTRHLALGYQTFLGQEVRLSQPHGLSVPTLMDASVRQDRGYRFVYVLPFTEDTVLIEDTHYVDGPATDPTLLRDNIEAYARAKGWTVRETIREESGVLPITLAGDIEAYWNATEGQPMSGLSAGLFHPTTGYSLPHAVRLAERIARQYDLRAPALYSLVRDEATREWQRQGYFRLLNRMLFLAGHPERRWKVMQRFYGLSEPLIKRFYAGRLTAMDKLRIVSGKPPVPLGEAMRVARLTHPEQVMAHRTATQRSEHES